MTMYVGVISSYYRHTNRLTDGTPSPGASPQPPKPFTPPVAALALSLTIPSNQPLSTLQLRKT